MPCRSRLLSKRTVPPSGAILDHATLHAARGGLYRDTGKRLIDLSIAALILPVLLPLMAAVALWLLAQGRKPFVARRYAGRQGRSFQVLDLNLPETGPADLRGGRNLSRLALAPRLWAVLCGQMSLIGPRPHPTVERPAQIAPVLDVLRPGLFPSDADGSVDAALIYARDLSLGLDLNLLLQALKQPAAARTTPECA